MNRTLLLALSLATGLLTACSTPSERFDEGFGDSVRHMIRVQTYQPGDTAPALRGDKAAQAMHRYRSAGTPQGESGAQMLNSDDK